MLFFFLMWTSLIFWKWVGPKYSTPIYTKSKNQANIFPIYGGSIPPPIHSNLYNWRKKVQTNWYSIMSTFVGKVITSGLIIHPFLNLTYIRLYFFYFINLLIINNWYSLINKILFQLKKKRSKFWHFEIPNWNLI